ncbi:MAG: hypothetical protein HFI68_04930 [Lachnospiraceae bacterium]|nr:hypothetical protein [Lachnospiraceae bacterium]
MRRNHGKRMAAGMLLLVFLAGCGQNGNVADRGKVSEIADNGGYDDGSGYNAGGQKSRNDTKPEQPGENKNSRPQAAASEDDLEKELAAYREERKNGEIVKGDYVFACLPNEENYKYGVGMFHDTGLDSRELNLVWETASKYVEETLGLDGEVWNCADPRMMAIYEDEDKGVADGYDAENIFLCEYEKDGKWHYLIIVREKKGADWKVLYHGDTYKTD